MQCFIARSRNSALCYIARSCDFTLCDIARSRLHSVLHSAGSWKKMLQKNSTLCYILFIDLDAFLAGANDSKAFCTSQIFECESALFLPHLAGAHDQRWAHFFQN
jgi:hypothetical protein